ncbi:MAG: DUF523 domain-containing protein [Candidatus Omnitrophota bacterium]
MPGKILVSKCLIGTPCAYDGKDRLDLSVAKICNFFGYLDVCPETEGGLPCPRESFEIRGGTGEDVLDGKARVVSVSGRDCTRNFLKGAEIALRKVLEYKIRTAIFKARSPSCGKCAIYSGFFDGSIKPGNGVTTALLLRNKVKVYSEEDLDFFFADESFQETGCR